VLTLRIGVAAVLVAAVACAKRAPQPSGPTIDVIDSRQTDRISRAELDDPSLSGSDALQVVQRLRPRFLTKRGKVSWSAPNAGAVHVSIDDGPLLSVDNLSRMRANQIAEILYLDSGKAAVRYGTKAGTGGVILVKSR
jgi:hypothetical protein